jgi:TonB-linked SusC/RagA family outer membrane protein
MKSINKILASIVFLLALVQGRAVAQQVTDSIILQKDSFVNIGFAKQPFRYVTGAISTVKGNDLQKNFNTNLGNSLYGRLPGLTVSQGDNEAGFNTPSIAGRSINTYGPGNKPLIIVDGFLGDYTQLVPEEIEEISLLKDASATAVYGSRGANGVLLITTKRGTASPLKVNFSTQQGFAQATSLPTFLNANNYAILYNEALANDGKPALYSPADIEAYRTGSDPYFRPNVNWYKQVLRDVAPVANYNLSLSGGNGTAKYFVLLNDVSSQGLFKKFGDQDAESQNSIYNRFNFRANVDVNLTKRMSATLLLGGTVEDKKSASSLYAYGTFNALSLLPPNAFPVRNPDGTFGGSSNYENPVASLLKTGSATSNGRTLQSSFRLNYDLSMITSGLTASAAVSVNNYFNSGSNKSKSTERYAISKGLAGDTVYTRFGQTTSLSGSEPNLGQYRNNAIQAFLNYHHVFGKHDITAMTMFNTDNSTIDKRSIYSIYGETDDANLSLPYKNNGGASRVTYVNNSKYIAEFSVAYMSSENYAKGKRLGYFPAASVGWIASGEKFLRDSKTITFLKIRASYGLVGNDEIGGIRFMYNQTYPQVASYNFGQYNSTVFSLAEGRLANPNVTWEKEKKTNIGIEATIFKQVDISIDVFNQDRYDILATANATLPTYLGYTDLPSVNQGKVNNKGFEAVVKYSNKAQKKLHFFAEANVFYAKNRIDFNAQSVQLNTGLVNKGTSVGAAYGLVATGLFKNQAEIDASPKPVGVSVQPGDVKYQDIGGPLGVPDGIIDGNDVKVIGNTAIPELSFGVHAGLQYKSFDLDIVLQGISDYNVYLGGNQFRPFQNFGQAGEIALERWTPQTAATATFPRLSSDNSQNNYRFSSFWMKDGSFIKLRSAQIGYTLSGKLVNKIKIQQARLFLTGTNLFSIDHIKYGDPEAIGIGYPALRTITLGAKFQF